MSTTPATLKIAQDQPVLERWQEDGSIRVAGTAVKFHVFLDGYLAGESPEQLARGHPDLSLATIYRLIAYYLEHRAEIDDWLSELDKQAAEVMRKLEELHPTAELRAKAKALKSGRAQTPDR